MFGVLKKHEEILGLGTRRRNLQLASSGRLSAVEAGYWRPRFVPVRRFLAKRYHRGSQVSSALEETAVTTGQICVRRVESYCPFGHTKRREEDCKKEENGAKLRRD